MTVFHRNEAKEPLPERLKGGVLAIGNFDGVHRGHQSVLNRALEIAGDRRLPALVLTFEPHPRTVFKPETPVFRLTPAPLKARLLEGMGFHSVIEYPFTREFSQRSADEFVSSVLMEWIGASEVVTGFDFHFGRNRDGVPDRHDRRPNSSGSARQPCACKENKAYGRPPVQSPRRGRTVLSSSASP